MMRTDHPSGQRRMETSAALRLMPRRASMIPEWGSAYGDDDELDRVSVGALVGCRRSFGIRDRPVAEGAFGVRDGSTPSSQVHAHADERSLWVGRLHRLKLKPAAASMNLEGDAPLLAVGACSDDHVVQRLALVEAQFHALVRFYSRTLDRPRSTMPLNALSCRDQGAPPPVGAASTSSRPLGSPRG